MKRAALLLVVLALATPLQAEEPIQRALAHSPDIAIAQVRVQEAEAQLRAARRGWFHPQVSVYAGESASTGATRAGIQIGQDLGRLFTLNRDEVRQAEYHLLIAKQELIRAQQAVIRQVYDAALRARLLEQQIALKRHTAASHEQIVALTQTQFNAGAVPLERFLAVQQALAQARAELWQAESELQQARAILAQLVGDPLP